MQKLIVIIGFNLFVTACGVNGPPVPKPAPKGEIIPSIYPPVDLIEEQLEQQAKDKEMVQLPKQVSAN